MFDFSTQYDVHPAIGAESSIMSMDQGYFDSNSCSSMPYQHPWAPELPFFEYLSWNLDDTPVAYSPPLSSELSPHQDQMAQQPPPEGPLDLPNPTPFLHTYTFEPSPQQPPSPFTQEQLPTSLCTTATSPSPTAAMAAPADQESPRNLPKAPIQCFQHGCGGRRFSSLGNYVRHIREKSGNAKRFVCKTCGQNFTRSTAKNKHVREGRCRFQDFNWVDLEGITSFQEEARP